MVKLAGPAMSLDASGTIGGVLTFSKWKGRPYVRTRVIPSNPKTAPQLAVRAVMKFLSQNWAGLAPTPKLSWDTAADAQKVSAFNAFSSANLKNWRDSLFPGQTNTLLRATAAGTISATTPITAGRYAKSTVTVGAAAGQWGLAVYMDPVTGFSPNWNNLRMMVPAAASGDTIVNIGPLASGVYYLRYKTFSVDGKPNVLYSTQDTITIP